MSTSTTTSEPEGSGAPPHHSTHPPAVHTPAVRTPVIGQETTTAIPVHLLFRDDGDGRAGNAGNAGSAGSAGAGAGNRGATGLPGGAVWTTPLRPAVVSRRRGTGEQPRVPAGPAAPAARPAPARKPGPGPEPAAPAADPGLTERPGPALPGWAGVIAGACSLAGTALVLWSTGILPVVATRLLGLPPAPYPGIGPELWGFAVLGPLLVLFTLGGVARGRAGHAHVLTLFGEYRGTVRRTGLMWLNPLLRRRRVDVRLRHWRSAPMPAVTSDGTALRAVVLVVWRVRDTARAVLGVERHEVYLAERVEASLSRVLAALPADPDRGAAGPYDAGAVGSALTGLLAAECAPAGIEVFSAQPTAVEYAPEVAAALQRRRVAAIDARHRDSVLTSVVDAVDDTVTRLTSRGLVELDDYERKALVKDLTVAFYTGRSAPLER
ncbi:SPFH domain-containing protein [Streptomyces sp. NPDC003691]